MLTYKQVENSIGELLIHYHLKVNRKPVGRLLEVAMSLEVYLDRGEFNGTLKSAIECLRLAGYEIKKGE